MHMYQYGIHTWPSLFYEDSEFYFLNNVRATLNRHKQRTDESDIEYSREMRMINYILKLSQNCQNFRSKSGKENTVALEKSCNLNIF